MEQKTRLAFRFQGISKQDYVIDTPENLSTPALVVFRDRVEGNIKRMRALLQAIDPDYDLGDLCPHVKTHKSAWTTRQLMRAGVTFFKASLGEVAMLVDAGVKRIFVAYPLLPKDADAMARVVKSNPEIEFFVQAGHPQHVQILNEAARAHDIRWHCFMDLDVGLHRTGSPPQEAWGLYQAMAKHTSVEFCGLHAYDGHIHQKTLSERHTAVALHHAPIPAIMDRLVAAGVPVPMLITGGTPSFLSDLEFWHRQAGDTRVLLSPGTWIYFDTKDQEIMPDTFEIAACILAQVMDTPTARSATLNMGHKRWAVDGGKDAIFSVTGMKALGWTEEHVIVSQPADARVAIGDYVLVAPRHICPTVNLWESFVLIGTAGEVENPICPVDARNR